MCHVELKNLSFAYSDQLVIKNLSMNLSGGHAYRINGKNGIGKTTLLKIINRDLPLHNGSMDSTISREEHIYLSDQNILDPVLSAYEHLDFLKSVGYVGAGADAEFEKMAKEMAVDQYLQQTSKNLSLGTKRKITFLLLYLQAPKFLILDEFFSGIDDSGMHIISKYLKLFVSSGRLLVFVAHTDPKGFSLDYKNIDLHERNHI